MIAKKKLILENGREFIGTGFGADISVVFETVCCTMMAGYQEVISDPAYYNKIIILTYPVVGSNGLADEDYESKSLMAGGLVVRQYIDAPSHYRFTKTLSDGMEEYAIPGISGIDTREVTRLLNSAENPLAVITDINASNQEIESRFKSYKKADLTAKVSCKKPWYSRTSNYRINIVAVDCGITNSMVKSLNNRGCNVIVVPYNTTAGEVLALRPDGIYISNGPENIEGLNPVVNLIEEIKGKIPIFGTGQGCLALATACGANIYRMKKGHHGGNHPVRRLSDLKIETGTQSHNLTIDEKSIPGTGLTVTYKNLCDGTIEGVESEQMMIYAVLFFPQIAADAAEESYHIDRFIHKVERFKEGGRPNA